MCGIIGTIGTQDVVPVLLNGIRILENRGYDSAGVATLGNNQQLLVTKWASTDTTEGIQHLEQTITPHRNHVSGIGHTRWATHGAKTDENAHPHTDRKQRVAVVHNGVIENYNELKQELQTAGIEFQSQTDTEVIAQLIGYYMDQGIGLPEAIHKAVDRLHGTWGIAILATDTPNVIYLAKNGSPLVVGIAEDAVYVASEPVAFGMYTRQFVPLENGEVVSIRLGEHTNWQRHRQQEAPEETIQVSPAPFPHWTIKEIMDQPESFKRTLNFGSRLIGEDQVKLGGLEAASDRLLTIDHLIIAACGTSLHAAYYGANLFRELEAFQTVQVVDASELTPAYFSPKNTGLLVLTQSGETKDVHRAVLLAQQKGVPVFSIVNAVSSLIARTTECGVYVNAGREHAVASTKAFTTQTMVMGMVGAWFAQQKDKRADLRKRILHSLRKMSLLSSQILANRLPYQELAQQLIQTEHAFVLGKGLSEPVAKEAALKLKEITYMHTEGYAGGALKHGPYALIEKDTPVFLFLMQDETLPFMQTVAQEVKSRGAKVIAITDNAAHYLSICDHVFSIPDNGLLSPLLGVIPFQLLAYELSCLKGINPDKPRNLAKAVTVD